MHREFLHFLQTKNKPSSLGEKENYKFNENFAVHSAVIIRFRLIIEIVKTL
jgi:hypothetical protein